MARLDIYFCLYSYYLGLDQYHYPVPYFDARNGPPNFLFHNEGNGVFQDRTEASGLNVDNDRYSFACTWGDFNADGRPDLYVVNDFGRNNLYRNNGDGTFATVSSEAQVDEPGAGMSACWLDFDNDGKPDIYAAGMWVAAGMRVFGQPHFHDKDPDKIRALYRRHMLGNSLYRNQGNGTFQNVAVQAGVDMGRWSWSTDAWDFDHDGYSDLYVANGYISGVGGPDVSSFFWRQVVAKSPQDASPSPNYERDGTPSMSSFVPTLPGTVTRETFSLPTIATARFPTSPALPAWIFAMTAARLRSPISMATADWKSCSRIATRPRFASCTTR